MRNFLPGCFAAASLAVVCFSGCAGRYHSAESEEEIDRPVGDFTLIERSGRKVSRADLLGKVWIASFLFSRCSTGCPRVGGNLMQLQQDLAGQPDLLLVTFSVDPEHDTPEVLRAYADGLGADPERWLFLTGKEEEVYRLVKESFQLGVEQTTGTARTPGNEVTHSTRLVLVDRRGHIRDGPDDRKRRDFDGTDPADLPGLRQRVAALLQEKPGER